ncbi:MotA/TolQ/ExbB proton channel family protein [Schlesneria paludicola]|uniref:MotA/TolQ/ExbB proton channel family protein n=1 Tax=Schlesneria paludicola TaxID=360056 RepID=UPI001ED94B78|nr:MotA/TolQ/ExbB proton channel family protein [Schlesneria paludicola]
MNQTIVYSRWWCLVLAMLVGGMSVTPWPSVSHAQDELEKSTPVDDNFKPGADGKSPDAKKLPETFLSWMIRASGIFGFLIMLVSFAMVAIIMMIALQLRRENYLPASFIEEFEQQLQAKDYQGAYESAKSSDSFIGRILAAGMGRLSRGYEEAVEQMQQVGEDETMSMEHKIGYLALIGSIAPMLGLLGTVQGMVLSFQVIANSTTSPKPSELADGIATALFTTLEGLVVAIPAIIFYSLYKNRLARFLMECGFVADNLMKNFQGMTKPATAAGRPGGAAPAGAPSAPRSE